MTKQFFNLRNMFAIAICLAVTIGFAACEAEKDEPVTYTLTTTISPEGAGTVGRNPDKDKYENGETVTLTVEANTGFTFDGWYSGTTKVFDQPTGFAVTMDADKTYTAKFAAGGGNSGKPGAVTNFTATAGNAQVSLSWDAPVDNGGSAITGYEVTMDNWATKVTKTANQLSHTYTGLTNGTQYTFKVRAVNANSEGVESTKMATPTDGSNPDDPIEWSLPVNFTVRVRWNDDYGNVSENIVTKIGENYLCTQLYNGSGTYQVLMMHDPAAGKWSWWHRPTSHHDWTYGEPFHFYETRERLNSRLGGADFMLYLVPTSAMLLCPVTGETGTFIGRPVYIREGIFGKFWMDATYHVCLKAEDYDTVINLNFEVTQWDETVEDFDGIVFPEEE